MATPFLIYFLIFIFCLWVRMSQSKMKHHGCGFLRKKTSQSLAPYVPEKLDKATLGTGSGTITTSNYQLELQRE